MSFVLGLTGSIGMGKSTTANFFAEAGVPVWDADAAVHRLYAEGGAAVAPISALCPKATQTGSVDREVLKGWIKSDPAALGQLEQVVHPLVAKDRSNFLEKNKSKPLVLLDIPLLYETGAESWLDAVLVVSVDAEEQRRRVLAREGASEEMFDEILARQMPDAEKRKRADYVIETYSRETTRAEVRALIEKLAGGRDA